MKGGTQSGQLFLGFQCTRAKAASLGLLWFKESLFKGKEKNLRVFLFCLLLFLVQKAQSGVSTPPSDSHHQKEAPG